MGALFFQPIYSCQAVITLSVVTQMAHGPSLLHHAMHPLTSMLAVDTGSEGEGRED